MGNKAREGVRKRNSVRVRERERERGVGRGHINVLLVKQTHKIISNNL